MKFKTNGAVELDLDGIANAAAPYRAIVDPLVMELEAVRPARQKLQELRREHATAADRRRFAQAALMRGEADAVGDDNSAFPRRSSMSRKLSENL